MLSEQHLQQGLSHSTLQPVSSCSSPTFSNLIYSHSIFRCHALQELGRNGLVFQEGQRPVEPSLSVCAHLVIAKDHLYLLF